LSKLGIKPLEVGLKVVAAYDDGEIFTANQLIIDLAEVTRQFEAAHRQAINLSVNTPYPTTATIEAILQRGHAEATRLAINAAFVTPEVAADVLARAYSHMASLASHVAKVNKDAAPKEFQD
jgi:large subunit ribosomal protein L10